MKLKSLYVLVLVICGCLLAAGEVHAQSKYDHLNVIKINTSSPRSATCYDTRIGHYPCLQIGVVIVYRSDDGKTPSISTSHLIEGSYLASIRKDFGRHTRTYFESLKASWVKGGLIVPGDLQLTPEVKRLLEEFVVLINQYEGSIDLGVNPEALYNQQAIRALYELTESFLRSEPAQDQQKTYITVNQNISLTLMEIARKGLDVSTSLIPFINDARDVYELVNGRDLITGEPIESLGRILSAVALVAGNGNTYRTAISKVRDSFSKKALNEAIPGVPNLKYTGSGSWVSEAGLLYRRATERYENRLRHILKHAAPDPTNPNHTVFNTARPKDVPTLLDKAWQKKGSPLPGDPGVYDVDMGDVVGTRGEKKIRIVVKPGTAEIITAYPTK